MRYRSPISRRKSKRLFTATALNVNPRNVPVATRGGVRL